MLALLEEKILHAVGNVSEIGMVENVIHFGGVLGDIEQLIVVVVVVVPDQLVLFRTDAAICQFAVRGGVEVLVVEDAAPVVWRVSAEDRDCASALNIIWNG